MAASSGEPEGQDSLQSLPAPSPPSPSPCPRPGPSPLPPLVGVTGTRSSRGTPGVRHCPPRGAQGPGAPEGPCRSRCMCSGKGESKRAALGVGSGVPT